METAVKVAMGVLREGGEVSLLVSFAERFELAFDFPLTLASSLFFISS